MVRSGVGSSSALVLLSSFLSLNVWPFALNPVKNAGSPGGGEKPTPPAAEKSGTSSTF